MSAGSRPTDGCVQQVRRRARTADGAQRIAADARRSHGFQCEVSRLQPSSSRGLHRKPVSDDPGKRSGELGARAAADRYRGEAVMTRDLANILSVFEGSSGEATIKLFEELRALGDMGLVAVELFRAQKSSSRAKVYRGGGFKGKAYDKKEWALGNLVKALTEQPFDEATALRWGWKQDPAQEFHNWVLY